MTDARTERNHQPESAVAGDCSVSGPSDEVLESTTKPLVARTSIRKPAQCPSVGEVLLNLGR
jgi:hypothetical protein